MQERRLNRLESLIKEKVATVLLRDMADPRLGLITVTRVKLDRELSTCKIYWSVFGDEKQRRLNERTLHHAAGFVRREIAGILHTRSVPHVSFVYDESVAGSLRVEAILKDLRTRSEQREGEGEPGPGEDDPRDFAESAEVDAEDAEEGGPRTDVELPDGGAGEDPRANPRSRSPGRGPAHPEEDDPDARGPQRREPHE